MFLGISVASVSGLITMGNFTCPLTRRGSSSLPNPHSQLLYKDAYSQCPGKQSLKLIGTGTNRVASPTVLPAVAS